MAAYRHVGLVVAGMVLLALGAVALAPAPSSAAETVSSRYGCFRVVGASSVNIRRFSYSKSRIVGVAVRGQKLAKWKRFCAWRGFWCPVETGDGVRGFMDKRYLERISC